ncbi:MAG: LapA family protein [Motiliproteus sp.]|nr:LapA family protein [Motiliproteus sp.]
MRLIKTLLGIACAVVLIVVGMLLTVNNQQLVSIDLVFLQIPQASLARWLIASFLTGAVLSLVLGSFAMVAMRARLRRTTRQLHSSNRELDKLRTLNLNTQH